MKDALGSFPFKKAFVQHMNERKWRNRKRTFEKCVVITKVLHFLLHSWMEAKIITFKFVLACKVIFLILLGVKDFFKLHQCHNYFLQSNLDFFSFYFMFHFLNYITLVLFKYLILHLGFTIIMCRKLLCLHSDRISLTITHGQW